jgi:hypothetical protein
MPEERIKILFLASNPTDISRIRLDEELREIDERISLGRYREQFELIPHFAVRPRDLMRGLVKHQPHILHFSGHGSTSAGIVLEDNQGKTKVVAAADIAELISIVKDNLRVVVLNSCYSALQASGIAETIDCVIGMNDKVGDGSAIIFSATFYENLAFGRSVEEAFRLGVTGLKTEGAAGATVPTLLTKQGVDLGKVYLTSQQKDWSPPEKANDAAHGTQKVIHVGKGVTLNAGNDLTIANH